MSSRVRLEHVEEALQARDPHLVELLLEIAAPGQPDPNAPPLPEDRYTFDNFRNEINSPKFYLQPRDIQRQFRTDKIAFLESDQCDEPLSDRLRSFEIILKLWESEGAFERSCLLKILRKVPLVYGPWKAIKRIFKEAEASDDTEVLGILSYRFSFGNRPDRTEVSK